MTKRFASLNPTAVLTVFLLGSLFLVSCTDLVQTNPNEETTDTFYQNAEDARQAINATYNLLMAYNGTYGQWDFFARDQRTDLSYSNSPWTELSNFSKFTFAGGYDFTANYQTWFDQYATIARANRVIANVPEIDMNEEEQARIVAEAKFIRGLMYFNLVNLYGGNVPMPLEPMTAEEQPEQQTPDVLWSQIEQDLQEAQDVLPESYPASEEGRATWGAATALLGRAHLQQNEWDEAVDALGQVVDSGNYGLLDDYIDNFDADNENHQESVFAVQFFNETRTSENLVGNRTPKLIGPRQIAFADGQPTQWFFDQFKEDSTVSGEPDPRLEATIFYNRDGGFEIFGTSYDALYGDGSTEMFWKKYTEYYEDVQEFDNPINFQVIRFGDLLLEYANALNEAGQTGDAYAPIDRVRTRANLQPLSQKKPNLTQAEMREQIEHEIIVETGGEGSRWRYMLRYDLFSQDLASRDSEFDSYREGREYLPIPQSEVDLNPNVEQNPSY